MRRTLVLCVLLALSGVVALPAGPAAAQSGAAASTPERVSAPSRPRILIQPRRQRLSANARRECRANLVQELRASGPVIVPRMTCWWE